MRRIALRALMAVALAPAVLRAQIGVTPKPREGGTPAPIYPPALRPGDSVAIVAPAGRLEPYRIELARKRLTSMGFRVRIPRGVYRKRGYLAGEDEARAEELMAAFRDPAIKAVFPGTGGYGVTRMLDRLDFDAIRANPKVLLGFSDITGLHLAIGRKTGLITFHGPLVMYGLGSRENLSAFSAEYLWRALLHKSYFDWAGDPLEPGYAYHIPPDVGTLRTIAPGKAQGRLTGGNLSLVSTLMGTPYEIQTEGRVLFLEDVNEEPYRIDRFLSQLRLAGKFDKVAGLILGVFSGCESKKGEESLSLEQVFADYFSNLRVPVVVGFPAGHVRQNATLPMNALVEIDAHARQVRVLENPVGIEDTPAIPTPAPAPEPAPEPTVASEGPPEPPSDAGPMDAGASESQPGPAGPPEAQFEPVERPRSRPVSPEILRRIP